LTIEQTPAALLRIHQPASVEIVCGRVFRFLEAMLALRHTLLPRSAQGSSEVSDLKMLCALRSRIV
jgi:hypothetical protein